MRSDPTNHMTIPDTVPPRTPGRLPVDGATLHYEATGTGEPVVLLHGLGSSTRDWEAQVAALAQRHRVISMDLRGHGRSDRGRGPYSIAGFAADVAALLTHLGIPSAHVCGISLGGMVAFQLAVDFPERVRTLAVINSGPAFPGRTLRGRLTLLFRFAVIRLKGLPSLAPIIAGRLFPKPEQEPLRRTFIERFAGNDRASYEATLRAIGGFDVSERVGRIRCPVLVLASERDYTPVSAKEAYVGRLADARLVVIEDSGHASPMDQPERVNAVLLDFWRGR
jgi:pimeloyl-ACP methyl ester carboxylesterase